MAKPGGSLIISKLSRGRTCEMTGALFPQVKSEVDATANSLLDERDAGLAYAVGSFTFDFPKP